MKRSLLFAAALMVSSAASASVVLEANPNGSEALFGPPAKGAFQSKYGFHVLSPEWTKRHLNPSDPTTSDAFACGVNVTRAAGLEFGIMGNEYYER